MSSQSPHFLPNSTINGPSSGPSDAEQGLNFQPSQPHHHLHYGEGFAERLHDEGVAWGLLAAKTRKHVGILQSLKAIATSSSLNAFIVFIPLAWAAHFTSWREQHHGITFTLCFLALIPLEHFFDWGGEQMAMYCGKDLGDLIVITLNNIVEATLAIILLIRCELKLLQSTIIGVVVLHLLLIPGVAFITGGARIMHQALHEDNSQLNHTLLTIAVMSLLIPAAFFAALDHGVPSQVVNGTNVGDLVNDATRHKFLVMSHGIAVILLVLYIFSRVYLHKPPPPTRSRSRSRTDSLMMGLSLESPRPHPQAMGHFRQASMATTGKESPSDGEEEEPQANPWVLIVALVICIGIMAGTTEWLVESVEVVRRLGTLTEEFFGLILLPLVSFAANAAVTVIYFSRTLIRAIFKSQPVPEPAEIAHARAIDLSVQFALFWMPMIVLLGWWTGHPLTLLFDFFEVALLLGACFIVNYVTADAKTNWAEGLAMVSFYFMVALSVWFYTGQDEIRILDGCDAVAVNLVKFASGTVHGDPGWTGVGGGVTGGGAA